MKRVASLILAVMLAGTVLSNDAMAMIYGIESCGSGSTLCAPGRFVRGGGSMPPSFLFSFDPNGNVFTDLGIIRNGTLAVDTDGLGMNSAGDLFAFQFTQNITTTTTNNPNDTFTSIVTESILVSINSANAVATTVGVGLNRELRGAVFDAADNLWAVDSLNDELLQIDVTTGNVVAGSVSSLTLGGSAFDLSSGTDIAIAADGSAILSDASSFYDLNLSTGVLTHRFSASLDGYAGLAFDPAATDRLFTYEVNGFDDLYSYDISAASPVRTSELSDLYPNMNAGRGDLASITQDVSPDSTTIPEPGTLVMMSMGLLGFFNQRRRRK